MTNSTVAEVFKRTCPVCREKFETTNPLKVFTNKQCADRSRNLPRIPIGYEGEVPLKDFNRYPTDVKQRILRGETGVSIVGFDLECTSLKPTVGRILCASFAPIGGEPYTLTGLDKGLKRADVYDDSRLAIKIRDELERYDIIIGHNSKMFDLRFLNARIMRVGQRTKVAQYHIDTMWSWRSKSSGWSGLDAIQKYMLPTAGVGKTPIEWEQWMRALGWDKRLREQAMSIIVEHCENDVRVLMAVYAMLVEQNVIRTIRMDGGVL